MRTKSLRSKLLAVSLVILPTLPNLASAETAATAPASAPVIQHLTATVTAVKGLVHYRESADKPWQPCTVGLVLTEGAEFQTGPRSNVQLLLPPQQTITLDRFGSMTLLEAVKSSGKYSTDVGLKHGRVRYNIEAPGIDHESTVSSPNGTLAVRDTAFAVDDEAPFPMEAYRLSGTVEFATAKRTISMGGGAAGNVKAVGDADPADTSLALSVIDPSAALARDASEKPLVADLLSRGAVFTEVSPKHIPIVSGGSPPSDSELQKTLPGSLDFVLRWNGNANLDLGLISLAAAETLYPATGVNTSRSGGIIPFNDIGGPHGGIELATWSGKFPKGLYEMIVVGVSGMPVNYKLNVFENKNFDTIFSSAALDSQGTTTLTGTIKSGQVVAGIVQVGGGSLLPPTPPTGNANLTAKSIKSLAVQSNVIPSRSRR